MFSMIVLAVFGLLKNSLSGNIFSQPPNTDMVMAQSLKDEGEKLLSRHQYRDAAEKFEDSIACGARDDDTKLKLATAYISIGDSKKGLDILKEASSGKADNGAIDYYIYRLISPYDMKRALGYLEEARKAEPQSAYLDATLGAAYLEKGDFAKALKAFRAALANTPSQSTYRKNLLAEIKELEGRRK